MTKKFRPIKYTKERAVLSDILPYETPITFSNRYFYDFLVENEIEILDNVLSWKARNPQTDSAVFLIFGITKKMQESIKQYNNKKYIALQDKCLVTIPFSYGISHKEGTHRMLSVIHPRNQVEAVAFYEAYKELIIYYSGVSAFSLRAPAKVARSFYFKQGLSLAVVDENDDEVETVHREHKNLKSYFCYTKISNIFKFFESDEYHRCEQKYNKMASLDISKCFDSLYTHSVAWATFGKGQVKHILADSGIKHLHKTFPHEFDKLMQRQNYNETNGILIGPEFSRVFAEIILQKIDVCVKTELAEKEVIQSRDYEIYRYVDDYFVFYNNDRCYQEIVSCLEASLNTFKLGLNMEKEKVYDKPIITEITIAKRKISQLISEKIRLELTEDENKEDEKGDPIKNGSIYINSKTLITDFKTIIKESGVQYKDIVNYTTSIIEKKLLKVIDRYKSVENLSEIYSPFIRSLNSVIDFCFFIYSVSPRVNSTIKLSRVIYSVIAFSKTHYVNYDDMHQLFKRVFDHVYFVINKYETNGRTQVETLYLLTVLSELGKNYWIDEEALARYFGAFKLPDGNYRFGNDLNYFSITVLLFYMRSKVRYDSLKSSLALFIIEKLSRRKSCLHRDSESILLLLDSIACPYIETRHKKKMLNLFGVQNHEQQALIELRSSWFTTWKEFQFGRELDAKISLEVY